MTQSSTLVSIKKADTVLHIVYGEVYAPDMPDSQGEFMTEETVRATAYNFLQNYRIDKIDTNHDYKENGCMVVESFIVREGDPDFIVGAWVIAIYVSDPGIWSKIISNELNGLSISAMEVVSPNTTYIDVPKVNTGITASTNGHTHTFTVYFGDDGLYQGGMTDIVEGHRHVIHVGTTTEEAKEHVHRYAILKR